MTTPLAHKILKEMTLPARKRSFRDHCSLMENMEDVHCFEMSGVWDLVNSMAEKFYNQSQTDGVWNKEIAIDRNMAFLPAPKTWIERICGTSQERVGALLVDGGDLCLCRFAGIDARHFGSAKGAIVFPLRASEDFGQLRVQKDSECGLTVQEQISFTFQLYTALAFINTPKIIGRRQHAPHRGLERDLVKARGAKDKSPLRPWTEIILHVTPPQGAAIDADGTAEGHLTGQRALHFCRSHLRIRLGKLELVKAHWRGDASVGVTQSRYRVAV